jgi:hypothetical protein
MSAQRIEYWEEVFSTSTRRQESLPVAIDLEIKMLGKYADIPIPRYYNDTARDFLCRSKRALLQSKPDPNECFQQVRILYEHLRWNQGLIEDQAFRFEMVLRLMDLETRLKREWNAFTKQNVA